MKIIKLINAILILSVSTRCDFFLYLSIASQIYVPGQNYSSINASYSPDTIRDPRFNIQINFQLNQVARFLSRQWDKTKLITFLI